MTDLIPAFDWQQHVVAPWTTGLTTTLWIVLMGFFVSTACGLLGNYLILRRMALVGDAISHSVVAGIGVVVALPFFLEHFPVLHWIGLGHIAGNLTTTVIFVASLLAGVATTVIIEVIHRYTRVKQDAAIGIAFTSLFALGIIHIKVHTHGNVHIDTDCVLYGNITHQLLNPATVELSPELAASLQKMPLSNAYLKGGELYVMPDILRMGAVAFGVALLIWIFYKELLVSSFDPALAFSLGINATVVHYALMSLLSVIVVSAFTSVGAILVVAMLILPGATAHLLSARLPVIMGLTVLHALLGTLLGVHLAKWFNCSPAGAFVVAGMGLFLLAWLLSPHDGLLAQWHRRRNVKLEPPEDLPTIVQNKN